LSEPRLEWERVKYKLDYNKLAEGIIVKKPETKPAENI
jgi:hypothetical protein